MLTVCRLLVDSPTLCIFPADLLISSWLNPDRSNVDKDLVEDAILEVNPRPDRWWKPTISTSIDLWGDIPPPPGLGWDELCSTRSAWSLAALAALMATKTFSLSLRSVTRTRLVVSPVVTASGDIAGGHRQPGGGSRQGSRWENSFRVIEAGNRERTSSRRLERAQSPRSLRLNGADGGGEEHDKDLTVADIFLCGVGDTPTTSSPLKWAGRHDFIFDCSRRHAR